MLHPTDEKKTKRLITQFPPSLVEEIDEWRFEHRALSRSEAVRDLVVLGLKASQNKAKKASSKK